MKQETDTYWAGISLIHQTKQQEIKIEVNHKVQANVTEQ